MIVETRDLIVQKRSYKIPKKRILFLLQFLRNSKNPWRIKNYKQMQKPLVLVFMSKPEITKINFQHRKKNKATDVLSFESDEETLGELLVCPWVIRRQAPRFGHSYVEELTFMILHGILHLLGYDHETSPSDKKKMFVLQKKIFEAFQECSRASNGDNFSARPAGIRPLK